MKFGYFIIFKSLKYENKEIVVVATFKDPVATCGERRQGVNFIHILQAAFTRIDPKSTKKTDIDCIFCTFGKYARSSCS